MSNEFSIGEKVRYINKESEYFGEIGIIKDVSKYTFLIKAYLLHLFDGKVITWVEDISYLEKVNECCGTCYW